jgi:hypothetical protein
MYVMFFNARYLKQAIPPNRKDRKKTGHPPLYPTHHFTQGFISIKWWVSPLLRFRIETGSETQKWFYIEYVLDPDEQLTLVDKGGH